MQLGSLRAGVEVNEASDEDGNEVEISQRKNRMSKPRADALMVDSRPRALNSPARVFASMRRPRQRRDGSLLTDAIQALPEDLMDSSQRGRLATCPLCQGMILLQSSLERVEVLQQLRHRTRHILGRCTQSLRGVIDVGCELGEVGAGWRARHGQLVETHQFGPDEHRQGQERHTRSGINDRSNWPQEHTDSIVRWNEARDAAGEYSRAVCRPFGATVLLSPQAHHHNGGLPSAHAWGWC